MQESQVVADFLFPADQESTRSVRPRVCAFHDPASGFALRVLPSRRIVTFARNVDRVAASSGRAAHGFGIVPFVSTKMLPLARRRSGPPHRNSPQRFLDQSLIMRIGTIDCHRQGHAPPIGQHRALHSQLAPVGGVFPGFFPHPEATCSSPRPSSATSTRCLSARRTPPRPASTARQKPRLAPTLGSNRESHCRSRTRGAWPSTDSRSAARRRFHWPRSLKTVEVGRLPD